MECQIRINAAECKLNDTFLRMTTFLDKQKLFDFRKVNIQFKKMRSIHLQLSLKKMRSIH